MADIHVQVKMYMKFRKYLPPGAENDAAMLTLKEGATLADLRNALNIPEGEHGGAVINGTPYSETCCPVLQDGDTVSFFASVAGG